MLTLWALQHEGISRFCGDIPALTSYLLSSPSLKSLICKPGEKGTCLRGLSQDESCMEVLETVLA